MTTYGSSIRSPLIDARSDEKGIWQATTYQSFVLAGKNADSGKGGWDP